MIQEHNSKKTSRNQIGRAISVYRDNVGFKRGSTILDYGGGRFDKAINDAKTYGCHLYVYDPFNRSEEYNRRSIEAFKKSPDYITCANVLNIIKEDEIVESVVAKIRRLARKGTIVTFSVHDGDGSGIGRLTRDGWQRNEMPMAYYPLILKYFPNAVWRYQIFIARA